MAGVTFDQGTQITITNPSSSGTVTLTLSAGAQLYAAIKNTSSQTVSAITFDSVALTLFNTYNTYPVYRLTNPTTGSAKTFSVTMNTNVGAGTIVEVAIWSVTGNDTTNPVNASGSGSGGSTQTINITPTVANSLLISMAYAASISSPTIGGSQTSFASGNRGAGTDEFRGTYKKVSVIQAETMTYGQSGGGSWSDGFAIAMSPINTSVTVSDTTSTSDSELGNIAGIASDSVSLVESETATVDGNTWRTPSRNSESWNNQTKS